MSLGAIVRLLHCDLEVMLVIVSQKPASLQQRRGMTAYIWPSVDLCYGSASCTGAAVLISSEGGI